MIRKLAGLFSYLMKNFLPDAYLFAIILTFITIILALVTTDATITKIILEWGNGLYSILGFAMQMILILLTGYVLALSTPVRKILLWITQKVTSEKYTVCVIILLSSIGSWINWGFGLIFAGLLALEFARRNKSIDFPILIAAAYSGFVIWHMGLSGSIPLLLATSGHAQNLVEQSTGTIVSVTHTIFALWNIIPSLLIILTLPPLFIIMYPEKKDVITIKKNNLNDFSEETIATTLPENPTFAQRIDHSYIINYVFALLGLAYIILHFYTKGIDINLNIVICIFFVCGIMLHAKPVNYIRAVNIAIKATASIALQFPLYGGIMGIMIGTGLANVIAHWFVAISNQNTYYLFQFFAAGIINMFVPSGGGQWAVQGPIVIEAAKAFGADLSKASMMVAWGDQWTNMIQPFWALPLLGLAGLSAKDIMGYTTITLLWSGLIFSAFSLVFGFAVM